MKNKHTGLVVGLASLLSLFVTGCASIDPYYVEVPAGNAALADHAGEDVAAELIPGFDFERHVINRLGEDWALVGRADFVADSALDWPDAMTRKGRDVKAGKVDYFTCFHGTDVETGFMSVPVTETYTGTSRGRHGKSRTVTTTTVTHDYLPYSYTVTRNEYHAFFFKKMLHPLKFGIIMATPDDALAKQIGTRGAILVAGVVPGKIAWKNDLFAGDVILALDGRAVTIESVQAQDADVVGRTVRIWRDGKTFEKTIRE